MIMLSGDLHGNEVGELSAINSKNIAQKCKNPEEIHYHIILGDCGFMFGGSAHKDINKTDKYLQAWFNEKNYITLCIFGNHENYEKLLSLPKVDIGIGGFVYKVSEKIYYLQRGKIYNIEGKNFLALGGGLSIDKDYRIPGLSWWKEEMWSYTEEEDLHTLLSENNKFDYIISHTAPNEFIEPLERHLRHSLRQYVDDTVRINNFVNAVCSFKHWYCGHYHTTLTNDKFTCLYKDLAFIN